MHDDMEAIVVRRNDGRFYCGMSETGRLQTARSLANAKLFEVWQESEIFAAELEFCKRRQATHRVIVRLGDQ